MATRILVTGIVQGVGYRYWTSQAAAELGVRGWVRNLHDGRVEIHAEGDVKAVSELCRRCHDGPRFAEVTDVDQRSADVESCAEFVIRKTA